MMGNFLSTVTKVSKMSSPKLQLKPPSDNTYTTTTNTIRSSTSSFSLPHSSHNIDESIRQQNVNNMVNHQNNALSMSSSRSVTSLTNSNPWESTTQPRQVQARKPINEREKSDNIGYRVNQSKSPYENIMLSNNERILKRGRRIGHWGRYYFTDQTIQTFPKNIQISA